MAPLLARRPAHDRAFERLYRHHAGDVYRYALALLRDPTEAEDATQTAFLNAYRALARGDEPTSPRAWLLAIVHNVCRMRRRSLARRPREVPLDDHPIAAVEDERPQLDVVLEALAELPLNQRAALVMREVEGRSYQEIAEVLGVTTSAVEALIFRARRRLRVRREALGALAAAPLPASLSALPATGIVATAIGSDVLLKAAAGIVAALLAGGAAYKASTAANGATNADRRKAPVIRRVLVATETNVKRESRTQRAERPTRVAAPRKAHLRIVVTPARRADSPRHKHASAPEPRHRIAPVSSPSVPAPTATATTPPQDVVASAPVAAPALPSVQLPPPPVQLPTVQAPQAPPVSVPTTPTAPTVTTAVTTVVTTVPEPPPAPKIP